MLSSRNAVIFYALRLIGCAGIIDDDFGMELLVLGNLVSLNLPVRLVYESLWQPHQQQRRETNTPPMRVIFRLQVLNCTATTLCAAFRIDGAAAAAPLCGDPLVSLYPCICLIQQVHGKQLK